MKKGLIFVLFALVSVVSFAQISWNVKAGMNMSNLSNLDDSNMKIGYNIGVGMEYQINDMWSIQPSLMFTTKGAKSEESESEQGITVKGKETYNPLYLELPIMAAVRFAVSDNMNVVVSAGPYLAYGIGGKYKMEYSISGDLQGLDPEDIFDYAGIEPKEEYDIFKKDGMDAKKFDFGLGVGVALEINKFFVGLNGEFGLTKLSDGDKAPKNTNFSIGVGYKF
ncbi:porin family protein [uncultured Bacteroides sp.]|uniref:porin family protein n=1 Tax=uncultured Bacteroides sp. TaxID=162156 RepID=UPI0025D20987|nr:porin family protein [uncultured Bacteroides sp.]